jgi:hypothetical protein
MIRPENAHFIHYRQRRCVPYSGYPWVIEKNPVELIYGTTTDFIEWRSLVLGQSVRDDIASRGMEELPLLLGQDDRGCWWGFREQFYSTADSDLAPDEVKAFVEATAGPPRHSGMTTR